MAYMCALNIIVHVCLLVHGKSVVHFCLGIDVYVSD